MLRFVKGLEMVMWGWFGDWKEDNIGMGVGMEMDITEGNVNEFEICW